MNISHATRLIRETCALRHFSIKTEKTYVYWLSRYALFLKQHSVTSLSPEKKMEAFLTRVHLLYACGLRVTEPLNLRIKDVDFNESKFYVYQAKGGKGQVVLFPNCLTPALQKQMAVAGHVAAQDHGSGIPVPLPGLLAKKYPPRRRIQKGGRRSSPRTRSAVVLVVERRYGGGAMSRTCNERFGRLLYRAVSMV